jgi:hypothetical protein
MRLLRIIDGQPQQYSVDALRRDTPGVSFPAAPSKSLLASYDVYPYETVPQPQASEVQRVVDGGFTEVNGAWLRVWTVEDLPLADAEARIRSIRDSKLSSSDWTQVADAPVDQAAWATYRQALRDVPQQTGFPFSVTWPQEP